MTAATATHVISVSRPFNGKLAQDLEEKRQAAANLAERTTASAKALAGDAHKAVLANIERTIVRLAVALPLVALVLAYLLSTHANIQLIIHIAPVLVLALVAQPVLCVLNRVSCSQDA